MASAAASVEAGLTCSTCAGGFGGLSVPPFVASGGTFSAAGGPPKIACSPPLIWAPRPGIFTPVATLTARTVPEPS